MVESQATNAEAAAKQRIHVFSASRTCPEIQLKPQNVNSLDPSKVPLSTESKYH
jgi:hypothetical protein